MVEGSTNHVTAQRAIHQRTDRQWLTFVQCDFRTFYNLVLIPLHMCAYQNTSTLRAPLGIYVGVYGEPHTVLGASLQVEQVQHRHSLSVSILWTIEVTVRTV